MLASRKLGAKRKNLNFFVVVRSWKSEEKEIWVARVQLWCLYFVKGDTESSKLTFLQCMEWEPSSDAVDKTLKCVCFQRAATEGGGIESGVGRSVNENDCTVGV